MQICKNSQSLSQWNDKLILKAQQTIRSNGQTFSDQQTAGNRRRSYCPATSRCRTYGAKYLRVPATSASRLTVYLNSAVDCGYAQPHASCVRYSDACTRDCDITLHITEKIFGTHVVRLHDKIGRCLQSLSQCHQILRVSVESHSKCDASGKALKRSNSKRRIQQFSEHCNVLAVLDLEGQKYITDEVIPIDEPTLEFPDVIQDDICASSELPTVTLTVSNVEGSTAQRVEWRSFSTSSKRCGVQYKLIYHKKHKPTEIIRHTFKEDGVFQTGNLPADTDYIYELKLSKPGLANSITRSTSQTLRTHKTLICNQFHSWNKATGTWTDKGTNGQLKGSHTGFVTIFALPLKAVTYACLVKQTIRLDRKITVRRIESGENHLNVKWGKLQPGNTVHVTVLGVKPTFKRSVGTKIRVGSLDACTNYHVLVELLNGNEVIESKQLIEVMTSYPALNAPENFDVKSLSGGLGHKLTWTPITSKYPSTCRLSYRVERESRKADKVEKQIFELNEAKLELADIASEVEYSYKVQAVFNSVHYGKFSEPLKIAALSSQKRFTYFCNAFDRHSLVVTNTLTTPDTLSKEE
ncbi:hypothetical protein CLF_112027 [Clonorchis sinensis]|uniref:Fibronectin type-III domain-containing protein n=1 Tax=Clonorchis sinensis TaxID=79923 RepID=G7YM74_CLOSI|nr:hypothetical protein CLF_112027 [Clonorchis sinensis]